MSITFQYDPDVRILFSTAEGPVSFQEIETHLDRESEAHALGYRELIDATRASADITAEEVRLLARDLRARMQKAAFGPTALVTGDETLIGMARMFAILSDLQDGPSVGVFRSFDEALTWLLREL